MSASEMEIVYMMDAGGPVELGGMRLSNGETLLQRQIRLLRMCGVRKFVVETKRAQKQAAGYLSDGSGPRAVGARALFEEDSKRSILLIQSDMVFDLAFAEAVLREKGAFAVLTHRRELPGLRARIGMRTVEEVVPQLEGPSCFPLLPACRLPVDAVRQAVELAQEKGVCLGEVIWSMLPALGVAPYFADTGLACTLRSQRELEAACGVLRERDSACRITFRERGAAARLPALLGKLGMHKPLLICGSFTGEHPVKELLSVCEIEFAVQEVQGPEPQMEQICRGMELFQREGCDGILSAGDPAVIETAKWEALLLRRGGERLQQVCVWCPHIAVPADESGWESAFYAADSALSGPHSLEHDGLLPDVVLWDEGLWDRREGRTEPSAGAEVRAAEPSEGELRRVPGRFRRAALFALYKILFSIRDQTVLLEAYSGGAGGHRAVYKAMRSDPAYEGFTYIWAVKDAMALRGVEMGPDTVSVVLHSSRYIWTAATARFLVSSVDLPGYVRPRREQTYIRTWNGDWGQERRDGDRITRLHSPGPAATPHLTAAFGLSGAGREEAAVEAGCPENAFLFRYAREDVLSEKLRLGLPLNKKLVLWAPTWQPAGLQMLRRELRDCLLLIWRNPAGDMDLKELQGFALDVGSCEEVGRLLVISDLLVTDDIRLIQRYANLGRPIVVYRPSCKAEPCGSAGGAPGWDEVPGETVTDPSALAGAICRGLWEFRYDEKYRRFQEKYNPLEGPDAGLQLAEKLIPAKTFPTPQQKKQQLLHRRLYNAWIRGQGFLRKTGLRRTENDKILQSFRNRHRGSRCFLIGNGPSLALPDLEAIRDEYSFCCNRIHLIFDRTDWRPSYYFVTDNVFSGEALAEIRAAFSGVIFTNHAFAGIRRRENRLVYAYALNRDDYFVHGNPLEYYVSSQATVMTYMLEMAIYMGFQKIYLLGVDNSNSFISGDNHFVSGYYNKDMMRMEKRRTKLLAADKEQMTIEELGRYRQARALQAYTRLREYADRHGIQILNATRGGCLEVFERVNLDDLELGAGVESRLG